MVAGVPCRKSRLCDGCSCSVIAVHSSSCDVPSRQAAALSAQTTSAPPRARLTCSPVAASAALLAPLRRLSTSSATQGGSSPASSEKAGAMRQRLCGILVVPIHRCPRRENGGGLNPVLETLWNGGSAAGLERFGTEHRFGTPLRGVPKLLLPTFIAPGMTSGQNVTLATCRTDGSAQLDGGLGGDAQVSGPH